MIEQMLNNLLTRIQTTQKSKLRMVIILQQTMITQLMKNLKKRSKMSMITMKMMMMMMMTILMMMTMIAIVNPHLFLQSN